MPPLVPELGDRLRDLREARGLSRAEVGARCGLTPKTLLYWESGGRRPGGAALDRLLSALEAPPPLRAELLALADPQYAQTALAHDPLGAAIDLGMILRAFRLRCGLTQADVARKLEASQSTVAQWESGERSLREENLSVTLSAFGADGREIATVLQRPHVFHPPTDDPAEVRNRIDALPGILREPALLANERSLWWQAIRKPAWEDALRRAIVQRAAWYGFVGRFSEAEALIRQIDRMTSDRNAAPHVLGPRIYLADPRFRPDAAPSALAKRLDGETSGLSPSTERAWLHGTLAVALATIGERRAVAKAEAAVSETEDLGDRSFDRWHRQIDLAEVHLRLGDPERAMEALEADSHDWDATLAQMGLAPVGLSVRIRTQAALGQAPSSEQTEMLRNHATIDGAPYYRNRLQEVEKALRILEKRRRR